MGFEERLEQARQLKQNLVDKDEKRLNQITQFCNELAIKLRKYEEDNTTVIGKLWAPFHNSELAEAFPILWDYWNHKYIETISSEKERRSKLPWNERIDMRLYSPLPKDKTVDFDESFLNVDTPLPIDDFVNNTFNNLVEPGENLLESEDWEELFRDYATEYEEYHDSSAASINLYYPSPFPKTPIIVTEFGIGESQNKVTNSRGRLGIVTYCNPYELTCRIVFYSPGDKALSDIRHIEDSNHIIYEGKDPNEGIEKLLDISANLITDRKKKNP